MDMGKRIRERRKVAGITQAKLAELLGVSYITVRRWETEGRVPNAAVMPKLAEVLNTTVAYLMGQSDEPNPQSVEGALQSLLKLMENGGLKSEPLTPLPEGERKAKLKELITSTARKVMESAPNAAEKELKSEARFEDVAWVPVVSNRVTVCCGDGNAYPDEIIWDEVGKYPVLASQLMGYSWQLRDGGYHIITVEGDSMEPKVHSGDKILIADVELKDGDLAVCLYRGRTLLRGVTFENDGIRLHAWNKVYDDIYVPNECVDDLAILGKMLGIVPPFLIRPLSSMW
ncbi:MAG: helix-turn-helix domain-containing protein [Fretibacterium sp.]|nr:helix-turn-helix domain-containing protein [Fretibacterium sp.]